MREWLKLMLEEIRRREDDDRRAREQGGERDAGSSPKTAGSDAPGNDPEPGRSESEG